MKMSMKLYENYMEIIFNGGGGGGGYVIMEKYIELFFFEMLDLLLVCYA